ncbi:MAG: response regulator transcription factor [Clostridia bacterium]|nr:response regulator transcription factor [Clostridia bacterium]
MFRILIVEDSVDIYEPLAENLKYEGFDVKVAATKRAATEALEAPDAKYDLALVDLMLPDGYGHEVYDVAEDCGVPVIFLSANDDERVVSRSLNMGAVDYIEKPYKKAVLLARINKVLRNSGKLSKELVFGELRVDTAKGVAYKNGEELYLSRIAYRLLLLFMNHPGQIFTRDRLIEEIWNITGTEVFENTLTQHITRLRKEIGDDPQNPKYIQTVRGIGYKLGK